MTAGHPGPAAETGRVEPVPRRIRAELGGQVVLDTRDARYGWEWPFYPQFHVPVADVDPAVLVDEGRVERVQLGTARIVGLRVGDTVRPACGRLFTEDAVAGLAGTIRFDWDALDAWFEESEQVFVHPRNPYVRVDALRSDRHVRVELDGVLLAESHRPVAVFETGLPTRWYLDRGDVDFAHLVPSVTETACPYKGRTSAYWSFDGGVREHADIAWSYDFPTRQLLPVAGLVAFYDERVDVTLDGVRQQRPRTHFG